MLSSLRTTLKVTETWGGGLPNYAWRNTADPRLGTKGKLSRVPRDLSKNHTQS